MNTKEQIEKLATEHPYSFSTCEFIFHILDKRVDMAENILQAATALEVDPIKLVISLFWEGIKDEQRRT